MLIGFNLNASKNNCKFICVDNGQEYIGNASVVKKAFLAA